MKIIFFKAGFIDSWGRGYKKIKEGFEEKGMKMPTVEEIDGGVKITILRRNKSSDVVKDVVNTAASMARRMSVSERTIQRDLEVLQKKNLLRRKGGKKDGYWEVIS